MEKFDARKLSPEQQETLRKTAVHMVFEEGYTQRATAKALGVSRQQVVGWCRKFEKFGLAGLNARKRGRRLGEKRMLEPWQCATTVNLILDRMPDQLKMPFVLWTRSAVRQLIEDRFGITLCLASVGNYLKRWGMTPQKPVRKAYEQNNAAVRKWLDEEYPAIKKRAKKQGAVIYWGDETGVTNKINHGRSYSPRGKTPEVKEQGKKIKINMISALTNRGSLRFMTYSTTMTQRKYILFLGRLIENESAKVFFIADNLSVHHGKKVKAWAEKNKDKIELFFIPSYSPELNPDEYLNRDIKTNVHGKSIPRSYEQLKENLLGFMRMLQKTPAQIIKYFNSSKISYCADPA